MRLDYEDGRWILTPDFDDGVSVVRCKDCKYAEKIENEDIYCHSYGGVLTNNPEWYCASGERKDDVQSI